MKFKQENFVKRSHENETIFSKLTCKAQKARTQHKRMHFMFLFI